MTALKRLSLSDRLLIFFAAFAARAAILVWQKNSSIDPFRWSLDTWEYMAMMLAIRHGDWGFYMFILRPPGYPLVLSAFNGLFGVSAPQMLVWLPFQALITSTAVLMAAHVIYRLTHQRVLAMLGGFILAFDPMALGAQAPLLSEALFMPAMTVSQLFLLRWLERKRWRDLLICLIALQVMVLMRATALYYVFLVVAVILVYNWRLWRYGLVLLAGFSLPVIIWTARNAHYTGIRTYSTNGVYTFLFYKAVSTEALVTGHSPNDIAWEYSREIEKRLGNPPRPHPDAFPVGNYDYLYVQDARRYGVMSDLAREKLFQYHVWHLVKFPWHLVKQFYVNETLSRLIPSRFQLVITVSSLALFVLGLWVWVRERRAIWQSLLVLLTLT